MRTEVTKHPEFVAKMRRAGCRMVYVGFESVNPDTLKDFNKRQTVEDIRRSIEVFRRNTIEVHGMFMLGSDSDTKEVFRTTSRFLPRDGSRLCAICDFNPAPRHARLSAF